MNGVLRGYLRLTRPANLPTAAADILAGAAIAGLMPLLSATIEDDPVYFLKLCTLVASSVFLYAGGVVLNDVFDLPTDLLERPERPIPSGLISQPSAALFGGFLLMMGIISASWVSGLSGLTAGILALMILLYNALSKKSVVLGPLNMGICRGLNLILGMSVIGEIANPWYAVIPLVYIFAITLISRGEVHGNNKQHLLWAGILYSGVILSVYRIMLRTDRLLEVLPFLALFTLMIGIPLWRAYRDNSPENIKKAVISGVLSLILLDACLATGFSGWMYGVGVLLLFPLSLALSKMFAVT